MRVQYSFALFALLVGCTTEDGATGANEKVDESRESERSEDASASRDDAAASELEGAQDAATVADSSLNEAEDAASDEVDASRPDEDASTDDAGDGPDAGKRCGTRGGVTCKGNEFCDFAGDPLCGATDKGGVCTPLPKPTKELAYVCGCDKRTYTNASVANASGVSVLREGLCTPDECEGAGGMPRYSNGANFPSCDPGQDGWPISGGIEPVVCCVGKKQPPVDPGLCGGFAGFACAKGEFCNYEKGDGCNGIADGAGKCETMPQACAQLYAPVCGCDGITYSNRCSAHAAGISVKDDGACK